jgi:uroporphyrinogen decarboxylase
VLRLVVIDNGHIYLITLICATTGGPASFGSFRDIIKGLRIGTALIYSIFMQTSHQVIQALYNSENPDRMGLRDSPWADTLEKWVTQGYPTKSDGEPASPAEHFGFDMIGVGGGFDWKAKQQEDIVVEENAEWKIVRDGNGAYFKWWQHKSGTPEHIDFTMTSRKVWEEEYKPHVVGSARKRATPEKLETMRKSLASIRESNKWADGGFRGIWENMRAAFGDLALYENMLLDPDWIRDYCRTYTDLYTEEFKIIVEEVGKPDGIWFFDDLGYKESTFCAPELYEKLIFPYYDELIKMIHDHGISVTLHTCGYTESVLDLIVDVGFDGLHPMEVKAGNDPLRIADSYADKLVFVGGLDARVFESHDRNRIRTEVSNMMKGMKDRGARYVFGSDHSLSTVIDYSDFQYALEVYKDHMHY